MSGLASFEREALDAIEPRLKRDGYRFVREPAASDLPEFLRGARPDAIAVGGPPNLLIEVFVRGGSNGAEAEIERVERLRQSLAGHPDWRLELIYSRISVLPLTPPSAEQIGQRCREVRQLAPAEPGGALVLAWSLLEAVLRGLEPGDATRALPPGATIEMLLGLGYLDEAEGEFLQAAAQVRNAIAHGDLASSPPAVAQVDAVLDLVEKLRCELKARERTGAPV